MDPRLHTIEQRVGVPITAGGVFRTRLDPKPWRGPPVWVTVAAAAAGAIDWLRRRSRSPFPNCVALAASQDTLFVFAAGLGADDVGDQLARWPLAEVHATRAGDSWAVDITAEGRVFNLTGASMDTATLELIGLLAQ